MTDPIVTGTSRPLPSNGTDDTLTDIIISNGCSVLAELRDLSKLVSAPCSRFNSTLMEFMSEGLER